MQFIKDSSLDRTLSELSRSVYSWSELRARPLPDGVDPAKLERYLGDDDFQVGGRRSALKTLCLLPAAKQTGLIHCVRIIRFL